MCEPRGDHMPRHQGNKVAAAAALGDGFDLAASPDDIADEFKRSLTRREQR